MRTYHGLEIDSTEVGTSVGSWTQIGPSFSVATERKDRRAVRIAVYQCQCGKVAAKSVKETKRTSGSCGSCANASRPRRERKWTDTRFTHWRMISRCYNPDSDSYPRYGGRGIRVCERWQGECGFDNFLADMGERPKGCSIDRIDPNGDYEPGNVRWVTADVQAKNKTSVMLVTAFGESLTNQEWSVRTGLNAKTIWLRIRKGWTHEDAVTIPPLDRKFRGVGLGVELYKKEMESR